MRVGLLTAFVILTMAGSVFAADTAAPHGAAGAQPAPLPYPHPVAPEPSVWPGVMLVIVAGTFFAAAVIGPIVRAHMAEELPPTHSHEEDPGHGHGHGHH